jgi:hypothetical protein
MTCPFAPQCVTAGAGPANIPTTIDDIIKLKKFCEDMEREIKDKHKPKEHKRSFLQVWLLLGIFAIPAFILNSIVLLYGLKMIITLAKSIGG